MSIFQRFWDSTDILKDPKLFKAKLCVIIQDVPKQYREDIVREFSLKFNPMIAQNTKIIMAKIKTCNWGSLNNNLVEIRVSALKRLLPMAIFMGVEKKDPTIMSLMNHNTGIKIDDSVIELPEISEDFDNHREILSDEGILLFEENTDF
ncbi:17014_t:CDS:2, partial [Acaulospora morrowiae]